MRCQRPETTEALDTNKITLWLNPIISDIVDVSWPNEACPKALTSAFIQPAVTVSDAVNIGLMLGLLVRVPNVLHRRAECYAPVSVSTLEHTFAAMYRWLILNKSGVCSPANISHEIGYFNYWTFLNYNLQGEYRHVGWRTKS